MKCNCESVGRLCCDMSVSRSLPEVGCSSLHLLHYMYLSTFFNKLHFEEVLFALTRVYLSRIKSTFTPLLSATFLALHFKTIFYAMQVLLD